MTRLGKCKNCGTDQHPKGNVFTVMETFAFAMDNPYQHNVPDCAHVKVCNNCRFPHPFKHRTSAAAKDREAFLQSLLTTR